MREVAGHRTTIAVPVFNGGRYLRESLASALSQTVSAEVVVFDNASTDDTTSIALSLLPPEALRTSSRNLGAAANFNRALRETSSEYFMWLADDDRLDPRFVERCASALSRSPQAAACLSAIRFIDPEGNVIRIESFADLGSADVRVRIRAYLRSHRWTECYSLFRRSELVRSPLFTPDFGTDVQLMFWFIVRGPLVVLPDALLDYREYPDKSMEEMARAIDPDVPDRPWRKAFLWWRLWKIAGAEDVDPRSSRIARRELMLCLWSPEWRAHLHQDLRLWRNARRRHG